MGTADAPGGGTTRPDGAGRRWIRAAAASELRRTGRLRVRPEGEDILVLMVAGEPHACRNLCAHQHVSRLHEGAIAGCLVSCPMHGWTYDIRTGLRIGGEGRLERFPAELRGDALFIALP